MIMFIMIGGEVLGLTLAYYNVPSLSINYVETSGVSATTIIVMLTVMYLISRTIIPGLATLVVTIPFIVPVLTTLGINPLLFGIYRRPSSKEMRWARRCQSVTCVLTVWSRA